MLHGRALRSVTFFPPAGGGDALHNGFPPEAATATIDVIRTPQSNMTYGSSPVGKDGLTGQQHQTRSGWGRSGVWSSRDQSTPGSMGPSSAGLFRIKSTGDAFSQVPGGGRDGCQGLLPYDAAVRGEGRIGVPAGEVPVKARTR